MPRLMSTNKNYILSFYDYGFSKNFSARLGVPSHLWYFALGWAAELDLNRATQFIISTIHHAAHLTPVERAPAHITQGLGGTLCKYLAPHGCRCNGQHLGMSCGIGQIARFGCAMCNDFVFGNHNSTQWALLPSSNSAFQCLRMKYLSENNPPLHPIFVMARPFCHSSLVFRTVERKHQRAFRVSTKHDVGVTEQGILRGQYSGDRHLAGC